MAIPKYQVNTVRINDNQILITKINILTGKTDSWLYKPSIFDKYLYNKWSELLNNEGGI